ncbi:VPS10 domain-containing protein [Thalassotalea sp. PLHSN55]|uniref:VPS10 domain-containing protein n=1 Tax=Thalassotalea sp. PLHSN55 TaxID=3435888 RepID=UPI003F82947D
MKLNAVSSVSFFCLILATSACTNQETNEMPELKQSEEFFSLIKNEKYPSDEEIQWNNFGPGMSGYNEEFWPHPTDTDVMFMGPDMHVSYGTWNGGKSWHSLKDPDGLGLEMKRVLDIEFSMQDPDYGMAIDWNGWVYESKDRGRSWSKIKDLIRDDQKTDIDPNDPDAFKKGWYYEQQGTRHSELAVDPNNDKVWYIGAGDFWNVKANHKSAANPHGINFKYADYGHIWKTTDKGQTWRKITANFPETLDVAKIIVHPADSQKIIMATNHGLMLSDDGGESWHKNISGLPHNLPRDLTSFYDVKTQEFVLYLVEQSVYQPEGNSVKSIGGVFKSTNGGKTWKSITGNLAIDLTKITFEDTLERVHRTLGHWFGISKAESKNKFTELPRELLPVFNRIVVNPLNSEEVYVSYNKKHDFTFGHGDVWRTLDGGKSWTAVARHGSYWKGKQDASYWQSRGNALGTNVKFAHMQSYMDRGGEYSGNRTLAINAKGELFAGIHQQTITSSDKGESWQQIDDFETSPGSKKWIGRGASNLPGRFMLHETGIKNRRLLSSGEHGLWQTADAGDWPDKNAVAVEQLEGQLNPNGAHSISTVAVHPHKPNTFFTLSWRQNHRGKLRKSEDGGKTWENIATIFEADNGSWQNVATQNSLIIDPVNPDNMYFCATYMRVSEIHNGRGTKLTKGGYGFYRSSDGGYTWELSNNGFHKGASVRRIIMHPDDPEILYAALNDNNGGLYKSINKGRSWEKLKIPAVIKAVNNVFIDRHTKEMLISTGRRNGSYEEGGVWRSKDDGVTWQQIFKAPFVWQAEISPVNSKLIVISVPGQAVSMAYKFMNPGVYLSQDSGSTWKKINHNLANYDKIVDVKPDPYNENVLWASGWGSGWYVAYLNGQQGWLK